MDIYVIIIIAVVVMLAFVFISKFNVLKTGRNQIDNAFSSLDALFIKRSDLIPNLIAVVKQYMTFEKETLDAVTKLRMPANRSSEEYVKDAESEKLMKQIMIQAEAYPDLKASQQFSNLQYSFNECEEQIAAGRRYLSASITQYNNAVTTFPGNMVASLIGMKTHEWEKATASQRENVNAQDLFSK